MKEEIVKYEICIKIYKINKGTHKNTGTGYDVKLPADSRVFLLRLVFFADEFYLHRNLQFVIVAQKF